MVDAEGEDVDEAEVVDLAAVEEVEVVMEVEDQADRPHRIWQAEQFDLVPDQWLPSDSSLLTSTSNRTDQITLPRL